MTPEEHLALATINPELAEVKSQSPNRMRQVLTVFQLFKTSPPTQRLDSSTDIVALRENLASVKKQLNAANSSQGEVSYIEEDRKIQVRDGSSITVRIHSPKAAPKDGSPIFVVYHGGGFCLGGLENESVLCRKFTELGGVAVNVDYRLAPEHPFPVPLYDAYDALKWTAAHFAELGGNPIKGFLVGGISAGANFGAVVSHLYRDDKLSPPLTGAFISIPACIAPEVVPTKYEDVYLSREQNKDAPILNAVSMEVFNSELIM
jgi:acetyl esterase/lipase